jgi:RNA polymerase sigma-70 factor (ECF subfamily)
MFLETDDMGLVQACRSGRTEAFGDLVRRYQDRLYPTVFRLTGRAEDASDVLQDTFLRAYQKLDAFQGDSSFYTWIYRIAVNLALSGRRQRRARLRLCGEGCVAMADAADPLRDNDPSAPLERAERDRLIQEALDALTEDHRAVVVLKEYDGLHYEEIAATLRIPVGTVRSRLHRARCELRDRLHAIIDDERPARRPARGVTPLEKT